MNEYNYNAACKLLEKQQAGLTFDTRDIYIFTFDGIQITVRPIPLQEKYTNKVLMHSSEVTVETFSYGSSIVSQKFYHRGIGIYSNGYQSDSLILECLAITGNNRSKKEAS